jgi:23S rRNA pseudouridine1911/1915/1917 synthase
VPAEQAGVRLDKFLAAADRLGSRSKVTTALERGKVFLNDHEATVGDASVRLSQGDVVRVWVDRPGSATRRYAAHTVGDLRILHEDDSLIVLDKPAGMLSVPLERRAGATSAFDLIEDHLRSSGKRRPLVVHRIDLDTSGLVVFAKTARAQQELKAQFRRREPDRVYWAVVYGHPEPARGTWRDRLVWDEKVLIQKETHPKDPKGMDAISDYRVLERFRETSLVEIRLQTGKRNQIRIQARLRGHTLVGERRYVYGPLTLRPVTFPRQALHAYQLSFLHPADGRPLTFEAPLPSDFADLLARLRRERRREE